MRDPGLNLKNQILDRVSQQLHPSVWTPVDFLDLGLRDAVDKVLQRLVHAGTLRRIDRGLYDQPRDNLLTGKPSTPDYRSVLDAIARRDQVRLLVDGMTAANDLGLTDAVPGQVIIHTDGRLRPIKLGNLVLMFRHTAPSKLYWAGRPGMRVVQALHWLRDSINQEGDVIQGRLRRLFQDPQYGIALQEDLVAGLTTLPAWMQQFLRGVMQDMALPDTKNPPKKLPRSVRSRSQTIPT